MIIALASPRVASSLDEGLEKIERFLSEAAAQGAEIVCFPEAYLPGLRGQDFEVPPFERSEQERALQAVAQWARAYAVATILGMERLTEAGRQIAACRHRRPGPDSGIPDQEPARPERGSVLRARKYPANLRGQRGQVRSGDLPRGLALSRDGALGGGARRQDRLSSPAHGQRARRGPSDAVGRGRAGRTTRRR